MINQKLYQALLYCGLATIVIIDSSVACANSLVAPGPQQKVAKSSIAVAPSTEWNRLSRNDGRNIEVWTKDGHELNAITFFGGFGTGRTLFKQRKKQPELPKISSGALLPDIPLLLESTYRSRLGVASMIIDRQDLVSVDGEPAIRFSYTFIRQDDEVERRGEAVGAIVSGKLFLVTYEAPAIFYFAKDLSEFRQIVETLRF